MSAGTQSPLSSHVCVLPLSSVHRMSPGVHFTFGASTPRSPEASFVASTPVSVPPASSPVPEGPHATNATTKSSRRIAPA
ncbi:MAG TPA: hypothetical protein VGH87_04505 [Polyangiaceae bacterium]